jgi:hypothetical protein
MFIKPTTPVAGVALSGRLSLSHAEQVIIMYVPSAN